MKLRHTILALLPGLLAASVGRADDPVAAPVARKQFRQSSTYPYIFQPDCYLATTGPAPLRFAPAAPSCNLRDAPPLSEAAKGKEKPVAAAPTPTPATAAAELMAGPHPGATYQPSGDAPKAEGEAASDPVDFKRVPEEVLEFFRNSDGKAGKRIYLFDPIFQPAKPNDPTKSRATYTQKP